MSRVVTHANGRKIHVGGRRIPKVAHPILLHAKKYGLDLSKWPITPSSTSWGSAPAAQACLTDILGNDQYGDCTEADQYHRQAIRQAAAGSAVYHPAVGVVLATYSRDSGFDPNNPTATDNGCDETVVLGNDVSQGITNESGLAKAAGFIALDGSNIALIKAVVAACPGGTPICASLASSWIQQAQAPGFTWDVPSDGFNPQDGHCFTLGDFGNRPRAFNIWTWAMPAFITEDAFVAATNESNGGAVYWVVDQEILNAVSQQAPDGLDWAQLIADFQDAGGSVVATISSP